MTEDDFIRHWRAIILELEDARRRRRIEAQEKRRLKEHAQKCFERAAVAERENRALRKQLGMGRPLIDRRGKYVLPEQQS